jgi:hypothetical protein
MLPFGEIWAVDFEFTAPPGERPKPICMVAREIRSGRVIRLWHDQFGPSPPFSTGPEALFVAFYASAELGCFLALGWRKPANILDLFTEFRVRTNGLTTPAGAGLVGALTYFGLDSIGAVEKDEMRAIAIRGGPFTECERVALLKYCESDVLALERLLLAMVSRGRSFKAVRWAAHLVRSGIAWRFLDSGRLDLSDETFRQMARAYPEIAPMRELRSALSEMRLNDLAVGCDNRNRTILSAFRARTSRNQPSNTKFIFGPSVWLRFLIKPPPGFGLAYVDWSQQEFGIAAALSKDVAMQRAYLSGDPYLAFAKQAGAIPTDGTKETHGAQRELFKQCVLAVQYGMEADGLASRIGQPPIVAHDLLRAHHEAYRTFWRWSDAAVDHAMLHGSLHTVFGWHVHVGEKPNPRSLRNFPMQANGAEMLRLACIFATERGIN